MDEGGTHDFSVYAALIDVFAGGYIKIIRMPALAGVIGVIGVIYAIAAQGAYAVASDGAGSFSRQVG